MKRFIFLLCIFTVLLSSLIAQQNNSDLILEIKKVSAPYEKNDKIVFTSSATSRFVGIAFDFENYKTVHTFSRYTTNDLDGKERTSVLFYILDRPEDIKTISYRLIIDGLWTVDPENPDKYFDEKTGILLSRFEFNTTTPKRTKLTQSKNNTAYRNIHFIYHGNENQRIFLTGNFANWDPWIYEMEETSSGLYEINLPLPPGTYYYNYYLGMEAITDKTNPNKAYTSDGRAVSVITVN